MLGQPKINGLRCLITASRNNDMFKPYNLKFQSREGVVWNTLGNLEDYLLSVLPASFVDNMIDEGWAMDGEVYLPGYSVNDINHFVKDATASENKLLQYWCYDLAIENMIQEKRDYIRFNIDTPTQLVCKNEHINNKERLIILDSIAIQSDSGSVKARDMYLGCGYEGLILRNPAAEYQFGRRRVGIMEKFKTATEGDFKIVDIYREDKRNLPILLCQNDVNDEKFDIIHCHTPMGAVVARMASTKARKKYNKYIIKKVISMKIKEFIGYSSDDEYFIESTSMSYSYWGEVIASEIKAINYSYLLHSHIENVPEDVHKFFAFKYLRFSLPSHLLLSPAASSNFVAKIMRIATTASIPNKM